MKGKDHRQVGIGSLGLEISGRRYNTGEDRKSCNPSDTGRNRVMDGVMFGMMKSGIDDYGKCVKLHGILIICLISRRQQWLQCTGMQVKGVRITVKS